MSIARLELVLRILGGILAGVAAWQVGREQLPVFFPVLSSWSYLTGAFLFLLVLASFAVAFALVPHVTTRPFFWLLHKVISTPIGDILLAVGGLSVGLLIGLLLWPPLSLLPLVGGFLPIVASFVLGYLGVTTVLSHKREVLQVLSLPRELGRWRGGSDGGKADSPGSPPSGSQRALVDTSAIIDGRIADIAATGFLPPSLVVPRFVLQELQTIADSPDALRRQRGRRGLDVLERLKRQERVAFEVLEAETRDGLDVDAELVRLARASHYSIITNDYNLNRVAVIQGVSVLNVNELANAVKSIVLPGEEMTVRVIQEGKEYGQGVGYLDDGTMVVVEEARRYLNREVEVEIKRVLQTAAGRMVFAQVKAAQNEQAVS